MLGVKPVALVAAILFTSIAAFAQTTAAELQLTGIVKDPAGAVVPQAAITLSAAGGRVVANTHSSSAGTFRFAIPKAARYTVHVSHPGFKPFVKTVQAGRTPVPPIAAVLEISDVSERMDVTVSSDAAPVSTDPAENRDAASVDANTLEHLPVFDQDYVSTLSNFLDQGSVGTLGTTIVVDGMEQKDAGVTPSAVQNVKINNDPYSAEYSRPGRGRIEITTKSSDSTYHGTANFIFRDYHLNARNAFASIAPPEQRRIFEGVLTGPVGRSKKTSFLFSADHQQDNVQSIVVAQVPSGPIRENVPSPIRATDIAARISSNFTENHTGTLQYTYEDKSGRNQLTAPGQNQSGQNGGGSRQAQALGGYVLPEAGRNYESLERHLTYTDRFVLTPNLLNQFQIMYERNRDPVSSITSAPQIAVQGAFTGGGAQATQLNTENNLDLRDALTWSRGKHTIKTGIAIPNMSRRALDDFTNRQGTFSFASLADYLQGRPYAFMQQQGQTRFLYWQKEVGAFVQDQIRVNANVQVAFGLRWDWQNYLHDNNNFAPRVSLAYAVGGDRKTVLRIGSGLFYDRTGARPISSLARYAGPAEQSILLINPTYPDPFLNGSSPSAQALNLFRLSPNIRTPYTIQYSAGVERQIFKTATVAATYRGSVGISLFRSLNVNQPLPPLYLNPPDPKYGIYQEVQSSGRQLSSALDLTFSGKVSRYLSGMMQYSLGWINNNTGGLNYLAPNSYDLSGEYARADFDQRNRFNMLISSTPDKWLNLGVGFSAASGSPYTITLGDDIFHTGSATARPPGIARNSQQGPGFAELDLRWSHDFLLTAKGEKGPSATFAVDAFNLVNRVNYSQYIGNEKSPFFAQPVSALPSRRIQFTLRFKF